MGGSLLLGAGMVLGFAPFHYWWVVPLMLVGLLSLLRGCSLVESGLIGGLFGIGFFTVGLWWIHVSLHRFGGAPLPIAYGAVSLLAVYLGSYYGLLALVTTWLKRHIGVGSTFLLFFPLVGVLLEWVRGVLFTGFPWLALGYSLTELPIAPLSYQTLGALFSSIWLYWLGGALYLLFYAPLRIALLSPIVMGIFFGGIVLLDHTVGEPIIPYGEPIKVALLQGNVDQNEKFSPMAYWEYTDFYLEESAALAKEVDLIIWPETAIATLYQEDGLVEKRLHQLVAEYGVNIMVGVFTGDAAQGIYENTLFSFGEGRSESELYRKHHLVPFGEYIPFRSLLDSVDQYISIPFSDLTAGTATQPPLSLSRHQAKVGASICYEAVFGDEIRYQAEGSHLLVNVSNDAWFGDSHGPWQHLQLAKARVLEQARPMARATNDGVTLLFDHRGRIIAEAERFERLTLTGEIEPTAGLTSYVQLGDRFWLLLFTTLLLLMLPFSIRIKTMKRERTKSSIEGRP